jgi:Fe-S-cluster containining protein
MSQNAPLNDARDSAPPAAASDEVANIHLQLDGETRTVQVPIPAGQQTVAALFPAARAMAHQIIDFAVKKVLEQGRAVSCCAGCGACCRQIVAISLAEAHMLAQLVAAMPADRQAVIRKRFADALDKLEAAGLLDRQEPKGERHLIHPMPAPGTPVAPPLAWRYFQQQIPCPFLEDESCSIHPDRPIICREYLVTSPAERCARLFQEPIDKIELPVYMADAMVRTIHQVTGAELEAIPLVLALEWAEAHAQVMEKEADGLEMLRTLVIQAQQVREACAP